MLLAGIVVAKLNAKVVVTNKQRNSNFQRHHDQQSQTLCQGQPFCEQQQ